MCKRTEDGIYAVETIPVRMTLSFSTSRFHFINECHLKLDNVDSFVALANQNFCLTWIGFISFILEIGMLLRERIYQDQTTGDQDE